DITNRKAAEAELHKELEAAQRLQRLSTKFIQSENISQPLNEVLKAAIELVGADFGAISLYDEKSQSLHIAAHRGFQKRFLDRFATINAADGSPCGRALKSLQQVMVPDVERDPAIAPILEEARAAGFRAVFSTPLMTAPDKIVGVLTVHFREPHEFSARDSRLIDIVARNAADAINAYRLQQALRDDDRRKNEFLAVLAHELRNPLQPISNALHALKRLKPDAPEVQRLLEMIGRQTEHLALLVNDLLDISRITRGNIELHPQLLDLNDVIRRASEANEPAIENKKHKVSASLSAKPVHVYGDPARLVQVFGNLISNAVKYTPEGGEIDISSMEKDGSAVVSVRDNGVGVSPDMLSQIFELFVQADQAPQAKPGGGIGVGLALARSLVTLHGGSIEAFSGGPGKGCEFVVRLPLSQVALPTPEGKHEKKPAPTALVKRALVVDDNADVADGFSMLLKTLGVDVRTVYGGPDALTALKEFKPDVAFVDIGMPGMDGYEVARAIRATPEGKKLFLIALSGWGGDEHRQRGREAGFDRHFVKPIDVAHVEGLLVEAAGRKP
ncbi:MAG TPA: ATP-binding protein, partial [Methylocystis sp.]|nr:ATP-binding protein [Methylocystis sp.]